MRILGILQLGAILLVMGLGGVCRADVIRIKWDATGRNNGTSWTNAYTDLQAALAAAKSGDEIWVAAGTYNPTTGTDRSVSFVMKEGVALYGGFNGDEKEREKRNWRHHETFLSGDIGTRDSVVDNSYHVIVGANFAVLDGFTVTAARGELDGETGHGGGMCNLNVSPAVANCSFRSNSSIYGGGMYNRGNSPTISLCTFSGNWGYAGAGLTLVDSSPTITDCTFDGNIAANNGGGIGNYSGSPTVANCTFTNNSGGAMTNSGGTPAVTSCTFARNSSGIVAYSGSPSVTGCAFIGNTGRGLAQFEGHGTVSNCTFVDNSAGGVIGGSLTLNGCMFSGNSADEGGGLRNSQGSIAMAHCSFSNNSATFGGGIWSFGGQLTMTDCTIDANSASRDGGGIGINVSNSVTINGCSIIANSANGSGGGISCDGRQLTMSNSIIDGNSAGGDGGGMCNLNSISTVTNCTFSSNLANRGGGISNDNTSLTLTNCILWGDGATTGPEIHTLFAYINPIIQDCDIAGCGGSGATWNAALAADGGGNIDANPLFVNTNQPAGVDGIWRTHDDGLALWAGSPCINTGQTDGAPTTDIVGDPRVGLPDMGAYEGGRQNAARAWAMYD